MLQPLPSRDKMLKVTPRSSNKSKTLEGEQKTYLPILGDILIRAGCEWVVMCDGYLLIPLINEEIIKICHGFLEISKRHEKKRPGPKFIPTHLIMEFSQLSSKKETTTLSTENVAG